MILNLRKDEGLLGLKKQAIDRRQKRRFRAPVRGQGKRSVRYLGCFEVGEDIGPAESVDGLFRITDEEKAMILGTEDGSKDLVLRWIGVLKLVDQGRGVFLADGSGQGLAFLLPERVTQAGDEVVIGDRVGSRFPFRQLGLGELQKLMRELVEERSHRPAKLCAERKEWMNRGRCLLPLFPRQWPPKQISAALRCFPELRIELLAGLSDLGDELRDSRRAEFVLGAGKAAMFAKKLFDLRLMAVPFLLQCSKR